jgi:hypothetical protein
MKPKPSDIFYDDISDEDWNLVVDLALGENHVKELSAKVEEAIQEDWDVQVILNKRLKYSHSVLLQFMFSGRKRPNTSETCIHQGKY